jgi:enoyl-CoA hydratase/carnithine racemase
MTVSYELDEGVAHVRIDDGKANVLNDLSLAGIEDALARAEADRAGAGDLGPAALFLGRYRPRSRP